MATFEGMCYDADGLAELEVQGDKELKVRFYNIEDALDEKSWIAGIISETFGRKVRLCIMLLIQHVTS